jgi:flagellar motor switch protein FliN/FliY
LSSSERSPEFRPFHDVLSQIDIVLGTGTITVRECLQLERHSVVRLTQSAGADLHVMANGIRVAHGEVVIIDDSTAIRITEILPPASADQSS